MDARNITEEAKRKEKAVAIMAIKFGTVEYGTLAYWRALTTATEADKDEKTF
jgi:hypothetical protein